MTTHTTRISPTVSLGEREVTDLEDGWSIIGATSIPVDSAQLFIVDPCHLPHELVAALTLPNDHGVTLAALVGTGADGSYDLIGGGDVLGILVPEYLRDDEEADQ